MGVDFNVIIRYNACLTVLTVGNEGNFINLNNDNYVRCVGSFVSVL